MDRSFFFGYAHLAAFSPSFLRFRDVYFESPSHLINWFKKNPKKYPAKGKKRKKRRERDRGRRQHSSSSTSPHNSSYNEESSQVMLNKTIMCWLEAF